jgi:hypothetical protein
MSTNSQPLLVRAGRLACFCPPGTPIAGPVSSGLHYDLAAGFALAVLAQVLVLGLLPLAGLMLAPQPNWIGLPYLALLLGAAIATFPAAFLLDAFGRRAAFALGASHGLAGGLVMAWALLNHAFWPFCLGAFWTGIAQGFSLFYRHEAAIGIGSSKLALGALQVFGAGALAGLAGPFIAETAARLMPDTPYIGLALMAAGAQIGVLTLASRMAKQDEPIRDEPNPDQPAPDVWQGLDRRFWGASLMAGLAWMTMTALMVATPNAMIQCGIAVGGVMAAMGWHVIAMYVPAFALGLIGPIQARWLTGWGGLAVLLLAGALWRNLNYLSDFTVFLIVIALGWSLATSAATALLHERGRLPRLLLGLHDFLLFAAAVLGALAAGLLNG